MDNVLLILNGYSFDYMILLWTVIKLLTIYMMFPNIISNICRLCFLNIISYYQKWLILQYVKHEEAEN